MMYLHYSKEYFLDHNLIDSFDSKETFCVASDYFDKKTVDGHLNLKTYNLLTQGSGVLFEWQRYSVGHILALNFCDDEYQFGFIK